MMEKMLNEVKAIARENNVDLITAEHMKIINDKCSKEKNKK